jgi:hypothetical protein
MPLDKELISILGKGPTFSEDKTTSTGSFRASGHLLEQGQKSNYEISKKKLNLKDLLKGYNVNVPEEAFKLGFGIKLSASEDALKITFERLLFESRSSNGLGNIAPANGNLMGKTYPAPQLLISLQELTREHKNTTKPSGKDLKEVLATLKSLRNKEHLLSIDRTEEDGKKSRIVEYTRLIINHIESYQAVSEEEDKDLTSHLENGTTPKGKALRKCKMLITFNPIFALDIDRKYSVLPNDLNERTLKASGKNNTPSTALRRLRDYLISQIRDPVTKRTKKHEISKEKLIYRLGLDEFKTDGRRKLVEKRLNEALTACQSKHLPLIRKVEEATDTSGKPKYILFLNVEFPNPVPIEVSRVKELSQ